MGCAGLSLAVRLSMAGLTRGKKILLIDRDKKNANDRTWSFWETDKGLFEDLVHHQWERAWFHSASFSSLLDLKPYRYKMIRGIDFYDHCMKIIRQDPAFEILFEEVVSLGTKDGMGVCNTHAGTYSAPYIFNSIIFGKPKLNEGEFYLLQHFKGWVIRTDYDAFEPAEATLMDFRPHQGHGTTFVYVMPFSKREALVEYTLFTESLLKEEEYTIGLESYVRDQLGLKEWEVKEEEFGIIPMTNHRFPRHEGRVFNIGTAGGMTKASSGYTFTFIQKDCASIVDSLQRTGTPFKARFMGQRFLWYDSVLLNILSKEVLPGSEIFTDLFQYNSAPTILRFLDNDTSFAKELSILLSLPQWPFMKAGVQEGIKKVFSV